MLAGCAGVQSTLDEASSVYGTIGTTQEIVGLAPQTTYSYRLVASNEFEEAGKTFGGRATGAEGAFTTGATPLPSAQTGGYSGVTSTSAVISGAVNPDGLPASYAFELGVYDGAGTQYDVVASGSTGSGRGAEPVSLLLSGLQPGVTYAYRISVSSGYIDNESHTLQGAPVTFTTAGVPAVLQVPPVLAQLPVPDISFPRVSLSTVLKCKSGYKLDKQSKCVRQKKKSKKAKGGKKGEKSAG